ncbi:YajQ family cyclic di-GMP-binding protein [Chitinibacter fontanus]|uniref:Nucleotide-binding protein HZU75_13550 n=1 Tax=Chitinibacter fontanus TaxID=1737446 RepID=A0A7D5ZIH1_9NEIS|nr:MULTISPECIES: YajQ family cyclic di-GMP-binding protein [Chitinibacter]QLI82469.1 YajQ family cyclic di-GMP-binding protein [Chitinibacter fontanus]
MPSFDITSETDMVALKNAIDIAEKTIINRYDFKGTSAKVELNEKDKLITIHGDSEFQLDQIKDIVFPALEKKEPDSSKRLEQGDVQKVSGNKAKQVLTIKDGIDRELAAKIIKEIKDAKLKVQTAIQGDELRVSGKTRDALQEVIALVRSKIDFPLQFQNFRD